MKISAYLAASLDGFIARADGNLDWLDKAAEVIPEGEDFGYAEFFGSVDVMVMGRNTYDKVLSFGTWPYGAMPMVVLTHRTLEPPQTDEHAVRGLSLPPAELKARLESEGFQHAYLDGGLTLQAFLREGLLDELTISWVPCLIGDGIRLFGPLEQDIQLTPVDTTTYPFGFQKVIYRVMRAGS